MGKGLTASDWSTTALVDHCNENLAAGRHAKMPNAEFSQFNRTRAAVIEGGHRAHSS